ncbi:hypothetical protein BDW72DRAFT_163520 [Aspergillus terricola var. indicus]
MKLAEPNHVPSDPLHLQSYPQGSSLNLLRQGYFTLTKLYAPLLSLQPCTARVTSNSLTRRISTASVRQTSTCYRP